MTQILPPVTGRVLAGFSGTLDANGNAQGSHILTCQRMPQVSIVSIVGQSIISPNAVWTLYISSSNTGGTYIGSAVGGSMQGGPWVLLQNEMILVQINGGTPGDSITGSIIGIQGVDANHLPPITQSSLMTGVAVTGTISANVTGGPVGVTDAGLASSLTKALSQLLPVASVTLSAAGSVTAAIGAGSTTPYLAGATSWEAIITGGAGGTAGVRLLTSFLDSNGNTMMQEQRDTAPITGSIIGSGLADTPGMSFQLTANSSAHFPMTLTIYQTASVLPDQWYDSAIYGPQYSGSGGALVGYDGVLWSVSGWTVAANSNQAFAMPTYRGPCLLGLQSSQAAHGLFQELDYTGAVLRNLNNFPISTSGAGQQNTVFWLPANRNQITLYNDNTSTGNSFYAELRAIKDSVA